MRKEEIHAYADFAAKTQKFHPEKGDSRANCPLNICKGPTKQILIF